MTGPNGRSTTAAIATTKTFYFSHCLAHRCRTASSVTRSTLPPKGLMTSCDTAASCILLYAAAELGMARFSVLPAGFPSGRRGWQRLDQAWLVIYM